jgi:hypothetical protein
MIPTASLVLTTVHDAVLVDDYLANFQKFGHLDRVKVIIIPDLKTPSRIFEHVDGWRRKGLAVTCPTIGDQEAFLTRVGFPPEFIPTNSDNRRNVGFLMALESGADFIVSIDDDNYCLLDEDFLAAHAIVCESPREHSVVQASRGWFNFCSMLELSRQADVYPRGFPYFARRRSPQITTETRRVEVHINAGLWLRDMDLDGITWLVSPATATGLKTRSVVLARDTWSPINSQNTAMRRAAIAAYYFLKMGYPLAGMPIDRYGDIFSGYFVAACCKHLGGAVAVGDPAAEHKRNAHNYLQDATQEWACIVVLEDLLPWLVETELSGNDYPSAYVSLSHAMEDAVETFKGRAWSDATRGFFHLIARYMRRWARACQGLV